MSSTQKEFLESIGFVINSEPWSIHIQWGTVNPKDWVISRNTLAPADLLLTLSINDRYWNVSLQRRDEVFNVIWRESGIDVESQQLKFRKLIKWPAIITPRTVIATIKQLEGILNVKFYPHVNIQGTLIEGIQNQQLFIEWLGDTASSYGWFA